MTESRELAAPLKERTHKEEFSTEANASENGLSSLASGPPKVKKHSESSGFSSYIPDLSTEHNEQMSSWASEPVRKMFLPEMFLPEMSHRRSICLF